MPYINQEQRQAQLPPWTVGELNYTLTRLIDQFIMCHGKSYGTLNAVIGVLECAKLELYRRVVSPYEDKKMSENGDVYNSVSL